MNGECIVRATCIEGLRVRNSHGVIKDRQMKLLTALFLLFGLTGTFATTAHAQSSCDKLLTSIREYARYEYSGSWMVLVAPKKLSHECLTDLAMKFRHQYPSYRFDLFDATGPELDQYVHWARGSVSERAERPFPDKWFRKHQIAALLPLSDGMTCPRWQLFDRDYKSIAQFDRVRCLRRD